MTVTVNADRLERFQVLARECHVGRAADALGIGQAHLSRDMKKLETELGTKLFETHPKGISLTLSGLYLARTSADFSQYLSTLKTKASNIHPAKGCIGVSDLISNSLVPRLSECLPEPSGGCALEIIDGPNQELEFGILNGSIMAALLYDPPPRADCTTFQIAQEELVVAYSPMWDRYLPQGLLSIRSLATLPMIATKGDISTRALFARVAVKAGFRPRYQFEPRQPATMISMLKAGLGLALCRQRSITDEVSRGNLLTRSVGSPGPSTSLQLLCRRSDADTDVVLGLLKLVRSIVEI